MKRIFNVFAAVVAMSFLLFSFSACNKTVGGSAVGSSDIEISDPDITFAKVEDYDPETFDPNTAAKWTTLDVDAEYYVFLNFEVIARRDNDGQSLLNVDITFDALDIMDGTVEDVATGMTQEMTFDDADTGRPGKKSTVSFKIPSLSTEPKKINMIVSLKPIQVGESHIMLGYRYDPEGLYKLLGSDGYTKNLRIKPVRIAEPELSVSELGSLRWKHVKNADYYCIYETTSQSPLTDFMGEVIYVIADKTSVGGDIYFNIGEYISGFHTIVVRAFSNNPNIYDSNNSNPVDHIW